MPTALSAEQMKAKVRSHFEEFVNQRNPTVIETNMTPGFYDHDGPGELPAGPRVSEAPPRNSATSPAASNGAQRQAGRACRHA